MTVSERYNQLIKPAWAPPTWIFGPVWTGLYFVMAITFSYTAYLFFKGFFPFSVLLPFILNLIFNMAFMPLMFGWRQVPLATVDIILTLGTLLWALAAVYPYAPLVTYANIPYVLWSAFATGLQLTVAWLNR
ncbi:hypothetical protein A3C96_01455 [Candidatus Uhrbacteria bacterium RIFCSPHIGHO2_02_FULL_60_10]|uniref:TspO protein n=1 Tax=Candidatus Uhrbacteria bacterium RIFCSPHIGHO2_02_FULL_60_10 TaxID=1802392 RepID=A0A1F7U6N9_9BACT|nr:MAG: hypothetical protein A3C96_01455 [Candidatus Uhrbacteria bacterium RIFCSPHIGHO2_02_FULL_60_10]